MLKDFALNIKNAKSLCRQQTKTAARNLSSCAIHFVQPIKYGIDQPNKNVSYFSFFYSWEVFHQPMNIVLYAGLSL
jgi:hypothetical protein